MFEKIFLPFLRDVSMSEVLQGSDCEIFNFRDRELRGQTAPRDVGKKKENEGVDPGPSASADSSP